MSEILYATQQNKYLILNIEKQLCGYTLHQELLTNYKRNRRYPKGFRLKFNLSLCSDSPELKRNCNNVLRNASLKLRDIILKSVELKVKEINKERDSLRNKIKAKVRATEFRNIQNYVLRKIKIYLSKSNIVTRRNTSVIIFLILKAIGKTEDSAEENAKNITNNAKRGGQNNNRSLSTRLNKTAPIKTQ